MENFSDIHTAVKSYNDMCKQYISFGNLLIAERKKIITKYGIYIDMLGLILEDTQSPVNYDEIDSFGQEIKKFLKQLPNGVFTETTRPNHFAIDFPGGLSISVRYMPESKVWEVWDRVRDIIRFDKNSWDEFVKYVNESFDKVRFSFKLVQINNKIIN